MPWCFVTLPALSRCSWEKDCCD